MSIEKYWQQVKDSTDLIVYIFNKRYNWMVYYMVNALNEENCSQTLKKSSICKGFMNWYTMYS